MTYVFWNKEKREIVLASSYVVDDGLEFIGANPKYHLTEVDVLKMLQNHPLGNQIRFECSKLGPGSLRSALDAVYNDVKLIDNWVVGLENI